MSDMALESPLNEVIGKFPLQEVSDILGMQKTRLKTPLWGI